MIRQLLGKYRIVKWLGGGQFGDVYLAEDTLLELEFALKVSRMRPGDVRMLMGEARLLASLSHPNIVRFYSADKIDDQFVLVTEYVNGSSLREALEKGRMDISDALRIELRILEALAYAHEKGLVHRDLKPENVLISEKGDVKVADFGLSRFMSERSLAASVAGTPYYMAPEAWQGRFLKESDIWSAGVILYEMLTGTLPFKGKSFDEIRSSVFEKAPEPPSVLRSEIPRHIERSLNLMLEKDASRRPSHTIDVISALRPDGRKIKSLRLPAVKETGEGINLTSEQAGIVSSGNQRLLVIGGAGSGKTTLLVHRAHHLIDVLGIEPEKTLLLAFSRKAAQEMLKRLEKLCARLMTGIWVETFHSFALRFLRSEGWRINLSEEFQIVSAEDMLDIMAGRWGKNKTRELLNKVERVKRQRTRPDDTPDGPEGSEFTRFFKDYASILEGKNGLDFTDLILYSASILETYPDARSEWQARFSHILVDELQDIDAEQFRILNLLTRPETGLFLTGDPAQAIYNWRGADSRFIDASRKSFGDVKEFKLNAAFRFGEEISKVASNLMAHSTDDSTLPKLTLALEPGSFEFYKARDQKDEARYAASRITQLLNEEDFKPSDCIVLFRSNFYSKAFEDSFVKEKIPFTIIGSQSLAERIEIRYLIQTLNFIGKDMKKTDLEFLYWLLELNPETNSIILEDGFPSLSKETRVRSKSGVKEFLSSLIEVSKRADELSPADILDFISESKPTQRLFLKPPAKDALDKLKKIASVFGKGETNLFIDRIELLEDLELAEWNNDKVKLMSAHSAKGVEAKAVFLTGMIEGLFPMARNANSQTSLSEERRLCYVALSRAKKYLFASLPGYRFGQPTKPSRFLLEMLGLI